MSNDDFPTARQTSGGIIKYGIAIMVAFFVLGMAGWALGIFGTLVTAPINTATGVVKRVINPDHALQSYRWFHASYNQLQAKKQQIVLSKQALAAAAEGRKEARRVELLGLQQGCQNLVGQYNEKATRADTVIFKHPERFLPSDWPGEKRPLPDFIDYKLCS